MTVRSHYRLWIGLGALLFFAVPVVAVAQEGLGRAVVRAFERAMLPVHVEGFIEIVRFRVGDFAQKNDILVQIDCRVHEANRIKANALYEAAKVRARSVKSLVSLSSASQGEVALAVAEEAQRLSEAQVAAINVEACTIRAPFAGVVNQLLVNQFEITPAGRPLLELVGLDDVEIEASVPHARAAQLPQDAILYFQPDGGAARQPLQVVARGAVVDPVTQTVLLRMRPLNKGRLLLPGQVGNLVR